MCLVKYLPVALSVGLPVEIENPSHARFPQPLSLNAFTSKAATIAMIAGMTLVMISKLLLIVLGERSYRHVQLSAICSTLFHFPLVTVGEGPHKWISLG